MAKDTSISAKKKEQIQAIEATDDQLTTRSCLSLFAIYLRSIQLFPIIERLFGKLRKSNKGLPISELFVQILSFFMDGTSRHLTGFDQLQKEESYLDVVGSERLASSHAIKRFFGINTILGIPENSTSTTLNRIWRLSKRIRKISSEYCNDRQNFLAAQVMEFNANVPVSLVKADSLEQEYKWLWTSSKEYGDAGYVPAILISNHDQIIQFISSVLQDENKPPLKNEWTTGGDIKYSPINLHLKQNGIKLQYLGNKFGSFEEAHSKNLVTIITYHSSKGLDFKTVFIPFLNSDYQIWGDYAIARTLFFVALTRSREQLILSYSREKHSFLTQALVAECTPKNAVDELRRIQNPLGNLNNDNDVVVI